MVAKNHVVPVLLIGRGDGPQACYAVHQGLLTLDQGHLCDEEEGEIEGMRAFRFTLYTDRKSYNGRCVCQRLVEYRERHVPAHSHPRASRGARPA
jgi:hypothetical protein